MNEKLAALLTTSFHDEASLASGVSTLYRWLRDDARVGAVRDTVRSGVVQEGDAKRFVQEAMGAFRVGELFLYDAAFAGLAVALASSAAPWTRALLEDLSGTRIAEMPFAPRVAADALRLQPSRVESREVCITDLEGLEGLFSPDVRDEGRTMSEGLERAFTDSVVDVA